MPSTNVSLTEYLAQATRGLYGRIFGPDFVQKQSYLTVAASTFNQTYGRKIWDALNNRTVSWNAFRKVPWGPTAGWVLRTDRGPGTPGTSQARVQPVTESGVIPTIDVSEYVGVYVLPKIIAGTFGAPIKSIFTNTLEGGMGDIVAMELQALERDFVKECNQEILAGSACLISGGTTLTVVVPAAVDQYFRTGDLLGLYDLNTATYEEGTTQVVTLTNAGTVTVNAAWADAVTAADGDCVYVLSRAGFTSLDDICMEDAAAVGGSAAASNVYSITARTAGTYAAGAHVSYNSGVGRDLSLNLIDTCIQKIRTNGGEPKLILMGHDQYFKLERLLNAQQRYLGQEEYQVGVGDERTLPGTRTGLVLATYMGIPILPDVDCPKSVDTADTVLGQNIYVLDTDDIELAIALPTTYIENRDFFALTRMIVRGMVYMMGELRCTNLWHQAALKDLSQ